MMSRGCVMSCAMPVRMFEIAVSIHVTKPSIRPRKSS